MKFLQTLCPIIIILVVSVPLLAIEELTLLKPTGIYSVGTRNIEMHDFSRHMLRGQESRSWMITVFYPAKNHTGTYPYMPGTLINGIVEGEVKVRTFAKPDATEIQKKFPVIFFIPGRGGERQLYTILCEELASHGYVVIAMDQPYVANFVKFPDDRKIVLTLKDAWNIPRDREYRYAYDDKVIGSTMKDIAYVLNHLDHLGENDWICSADQIILMGHSLGANVAHIMGFQDSRIKVIVDIDSKITERKVFGAIGIPANLLGKPVLFIRGMMQYQEDVGNQLKKIQNATIWAPYVQHSAFSDNAYFAAKIKNHEAKGFFGIFWHWLFKKGPFFTKTDTNLEGKKVEDWFKEYRDYVVQWLETQVRH